MIGSKLGRGCTRFQKRLNMSSLQVEDTVEDEQEEEEVEEDN